ncbi:hypothetical protein FHEFKHOI_00512 [Candidatus Methanoperedenaceae archaeon GB50]|nr:hypothetical protein FHEFKHOI_00512 [Candidatus Methanoperedenaceae archaeon GB50]CAD7777056.1 MAG: hypothetical protein KBONHNOK_01001 [Candidatus Methanoperedenaceae archaeon GB50]
MDCRLIIERVAIACTENVLDLDRLFEREGY